MPAFFLCLKQWTISVHVAWLHGPPTVQAKVCCWQVGLSAGRSICFPIPEPNYSWSRRYVISRSLTILHCLCWTWCKKMHTLLLSRGYQICRTKFWWSMKILNYVRKYWNVLCLLSLSVLSFSNFCWSVIDWLIDWLIEQVNWLIGCLINVFSICHCP